ncbi:SDR family oxidoreductase [Paraburkholderia sp.]|uniref:SDR family oxidoreductase n=1 Tax=Paraburkholderia sp. TaxID=1926495 RepID=UPI002D72AB94|nr:SDR family oxidoreductase [Paraburkholderia sp.]HZZ02753.1 SDR family oxidoreductase [Paraburkholderia sp.]
MKAIRNGMTVVITGASAGVGRASAHEFARQGAKIALIGRDKAALDDVRREVEELGGQAMAIALDVSDPAAVEAAATRAETELGEIDVWVNNAMTTVFAPLHDISPDEYRRATEVTYLGYVWGTMSALRRMRARNRGMIVQVGSALAYRSIPLQSPYCGAKHAIRGFTDSVRSELMHDRSRVHLTMVQMPALNTPQFEWAECLLPHPPQPVPPIYQPEVAARAVVWAAAHRRRELYVGSSTIKAIWANKFIAGLLDRYLAHAGYSAQMQDRTVAGDRPSNLWNPVPGLHATHGPFSDRASASSTALWLDQNRNWLLAGAATGLIATLLAIRRK